MKKVRTIGCEEALRHLLTYLDRELGEIQSRRVAQHLAICRSCFSRGEFEKRLKEQLREVGAGPVDPSFRARIKALIQDF